MVSEPRDVVRVNLHISNPPRNGIILVKRSRPIAVRILPCVVAALVFTVGCESPPQERVVDLTVPVTVQPVSLGTIESMVSTNGTLRAESEAEMINEVRGNLYFIDINGRKPVEGTRVEAGQLIARIESEEHVNTVRMESKRLAVENTEKSLEDKIALFEEGLGLESEVDAARKSVADANSDYQNGLIQLGKMNIHAPISGFLTALTDLTESTLVEQNTVIGKVVSYGQIIVDLKIPNSQMHQIDFAMEVRVTNYAFADETFSGRIAVMDPTLDPATRTFRVEAAIDNPDRKLRPGMFVRADVITESRRDIVVVPRELILTRQNRRVVFIEEAGRAQMRVIETGLEDDALVEVVDGLSEGERLITSNYETLRSRTQVRVTGEAGPGGVGG